MVAFSGVWIYRKYPQLEKVNVGLSNVLKWCMLYPTINMLDHIAFALTFGAFTFSDCELLHFALMNIEPFK